MSGETKRTEHIDSYLNNVTCVYMMQCLQYVACVITRTEHCVFERKLDFLRVHFDSMAEWSMAAVSSTVLSWVRIPLLSMSFFFSQSSSYKENQMYYLVCSKYFQRAQY